MATFQGDGVAIVCEGLKADGTVGRVVRKG
jgi:hypothetical protein